MATLSENQKALLSLIKRSTCDTDGWYLVSPMVWLVVDGKLPSDLVETKPSEKGGGFLRLTDRGRAVSDYLA